MDKLIITAACDSRVSYPANHYCLPSTRENVPEIAAEYVRCLEAGASIAHLQARVPLMELGPDMMSVAFNSHDEYFQPDPEYPPNAIYSLHPLEELHDYARVTAKHQVKMEVESFHSGALWNLRRLQAEGLLPGPVWTTLFVDWAGGSWTPPEERALQFMVDSLPAGVNWNLSVMSPTRQWNLLAMAIGLGGHIRVG